MIANVVRQELPHDTHKSGRQIRQIIKLNIANVLGNRWAG
jgi:hypothetical protein